MELLKQIERDGEARVQAVLHEAEAEAQRRLAEAERQLQLWREEAIRQAKQEIEVQKMLILSRTRAQARSLVLKAKSEAGEKLFQALSNEAAELRADHEQYRSFLEHCLKEAESAIQGPLILQIDPRDQGVFQELLQGRPHKVVGHIKTLGGFIASNERGDLLVDDRLETRIANLHQHYRPELSSALFDRAIPK